MKEQRAGLPGIARKWPDGGESEIGPRVFACIVDFLAHYGSCFPDQPAILARGGAALSYGALWARTGEIIRALREFGIGAGDRVAVVLPGGADAAVATIAVA